MIIFNILSNNTSSSDKRLAHMALVYVGRIGLQCDRVDDENMFLASASVLRNIRAVVRKRFILCDILVIAKKKVFPPGSSSLRR